MMLEGLGGRIRRRREKRGLKQSDIASALRISAQAVSKWERGENAPDIALLPQLSRLLDVSADWLLGLSGADKDVFEATVFVSSVAGYASKSHEIGPRELASWANGFFYHLTEAVTAGDGVPIKQTGDGLLCFFAGPGHQGRAVAAARRACGGSTESLTVALCAGPIYLGSVGHPDYATPDIIGDTVNVAFRTLEMASALPGASIMACASVIDGLEERPPLKGPFEKELTFIPGPVILYEIAVDG